MKVSKACTWSARPSAGVVVGGTKVGEGDGEDVGVDGAAGVAGAAVGMAVGEKAVAVARMADEIGVAGDGGTGAVETAVAGGEAIVAIGTGLAAEVTFAVVASGVLWREA